MVSKMNYDDRYDKALKYIFGRTLICRNLEVATQLAKTCRLDCVTMDGDQVCGRGSYTLGRNGGRRAEMLGYVKVISRACRCTNCHCHIMPSLIYDREFVCML